MKAPIFAPSRLFQHCTIHPKEMIWLGFVVFVCLLLALDLYVLNREPHQITLKESIRWTFFWVALSLAFGGFVYWAYETHFQGIGLHVGEPHSGKEAMIKYFTGYLIEWSLSLDNVFVIAVIFKYFAVPARYQHRVLFWGILGAIVFRGLFIGAGVWLIHKFQFMVYIFGVILLWSAWKMWQSDEESVEPEHNPVIRLIRRWLPVTRSLHGEKFFIKKGRVLAATPLFVALMVIETTDVMFAFDSVPAIFAITTDPFLVFSSNIFAILGLRSLYFVLAAFMDKLAYLKQSLVIVLGWVGVKMLISHHVDLPDWISLAIVVGVLGAGVSLSLLRRKNEKPEMPEAEETQPQKAETSVKEH